MAKHFKNHGPFRSEPQGKYYEKPAVPEESEGRHYEKPDIPDEIQGRHYEKTAVPAEAQGRHFEKPDAPAEPQGRHFEKQSSAEEPQGKHYVRQSGQGEPQGKYFKAEAPAAEPEEKNNITETPSGETQGRYYKKDTPDSKSQGEQQNKSNAKTLWKKPKRTWKKPDVSKLANTVKTACLTFAEKISASFKRAADVVSSKFKSFRSGHFGESGENKERFKITKPAFFSKKDTPENSEPDKKLSKKLKKEEKKKKFSSENLPSSEQLEAELNWERNKKSSNGLLRNTIFALITVAAAAVLVATLFLPILQIYGTSMTPTLTEGEVVVSFKRSDFGRGDVISFYYNNKILVKRVIAFEGDFINIKDDGTVLVNNKEIDEPYLTEKAFGECDLKLPYQVPAGKIFVLGDHRETSIDSRSSVMGCVSEEQIVGKIVFRVWPLDRFGGIG